jgi:hypothetical protein
MTTTPDTWPPDWRALRAEALDAVVIRAGVVLAELDELEQLFSEDEDLCSTARQLAGRVRTRRNEIRDEAQAYRRAVGELAA